MSRRMGKPTICMGENKGTDQLRSNCKIKLIRAFVFARRIVQFLYFFNPKFITFKKVQVGKDQEKAQSEKVSHSKNRGGEKTN